MLRGPGTENSGDSGNDRRDRDPRMNPAHALPVLLNDSPVLTA